MFDEIEIGKYTINQLCTTSEDLEKSRKKYQCKGIH